MYTVIGATGHTGSVVAEKLLAAGADVRVVGRSAEKLQPFVDSGAEAFVGDVTNPDSATEALTGAEGAYVLIPPDYAAVNFREYSRRAGESIATGIINAGVKHVVNLSSVGAHQAGGNGPIDGLHEQELRLNGLKDVNILHIRAAMFMENMFFSMGALKEFGMFGELLGGDISFPWIATKDIGDYAAERLLRKDFSGHSARELLGQRDLTYDEIATIIGKAIGIEDLQYTQFSTGDVESGMLEMGLSEDMVDVLFTMANSFNEGHLEVQEERSAGNTTPTSIEEFARVYAAVYKG